MNDTVAPFRGYVLAQLLLATAAAPAVALAATSRNVEWWLDAGFYGAFVGGLLVVGLGRLLGDAVERELEEAPAIA